MTFQGVATVQARNRSNIHHNHDLHIRLNQDLIALEAKYHSSCRKNYIKSTIADPTDTSSQNLSFKTLIDRVEKRLDSGQALQLSVLTVELNEIEKFTVSTQSELAEKEIRSYTSKWLMIKLQHYYGDRIAVYEPKDKRQSHWIYSSKITLHSVLDKVNRAAMTNQHVVVDNSTHSSHISIDAVLTHAATILRNSVDNEILLVSEVSELSLRKSLEFLPRELKTFMTALCGEEKSELNGASLSVAQDLVRLIKPKARTPKAICLGVLVKKITNNKSLIDHLYRLGHCLSYKDIISVDTNLAKQILDSSAVVGMVVPANLISRDQGGGFLQAAADNIDFLEETLDGKNTTHATSAVFYQVKGNNN